MATFEQCQRAYDNMSPPEDDDNECPICGGSISADDDGWKCDDPDCDWSAYPDYGDDTPEED
jgi:hypothetical protein